MTSLSLLFRVVIDLSNIVQLEGRHGGEKKEGELMKKKDEFGNVNFFIRITLRDYYNFYNLLNSHSHYHISIVLLPFYDTPYKEFSNYHDYEGIRLLF